MLGAYFGSTKIVQGAAGLGQDGPLTAYSDGVVGGGSGSETYPGLLFAYQDGSLGDAPTAAFADGVVGGAADDPEMPGPLMSYQDGILGSHGLAVQYESGGAGDGGAMERTADMPAPVQAYQDGVFGGRGTCGLGDDNPNTYEGDTPISAWHDGSLGLRYDGMSTFGLLAAYHDGSLGAVAAGGAVLDLGDAATLAEVKALIAYSSGGYALSAEAQKVYTPEWYTSGIWEPSASALWQLVVSAIPAFSGKSVSGTAGAQTFPSGVGIAYLYEALAAPAAGAMGPEQARKTFPIVASWIAAKGGSVAAPFLSVADRAKGQRGAEAGAAMSKVAMWGLGAAALLGVALVLRKR